MRLGRITWRPQASRRARWERCSVCQAPPQQRCVDLKHTPEGWTADLGPDETRTTHPHRMERT